MTKYYGACKMTQESLDKFNKKVRETLDRYYRIHDADSFFSIVGLLDFCREYEFTREEVPALIEMQNVIVMG